MEKNMHLPALSVANINNLIVAVTLLNCPHRHLQSCVGTWARLGYAAFDVQLRKAYFVTTLYAIHSLCTLMLYAGDHVSSRPIPVI